MKMQHTPGPWKVGQYLGRSTSFCVHMDVGDKGRGLDIVDAVCGLDTDQRRANARLIAAIEQALAVQPKQEPEALKPLEAVWRWTALKDGKEIYQYSDKGAPSMFSKSAVQLPTQPQPKQEPVQFDVTIDDNKAKLLWDMLGEDREDLCDVRLLAGFGHSGYGLYVASADYPEEGADLLATITAPQPQREWVGLSKEDIPGDNSQMHDHHEYFIKGMIWADAKLRERNT